MNAIPVPEPDFRALFHAAPTPFLVLTPGFAIAAVNDAYLSVTQTRRQDLLGRNVFDAFPDNPGDPNATGAQNLRDSLERVLRHRAPDTMAVQKYDIPVGSPPQARFEERYWSPVNAPVLDAAGELHYIIHRVEDVTAFARSQSHAAGQDLTIAAQALEIQAANQRLRASELRAAAEAGQAEAERRRLKAVLDAAPVGIFVADAHGRLVATNPAAQRLWGADLVAAGHRVDFASWTGWWADGPQRGAALQPGDWPMARALHGETVSGETIEIQTLHAVPRRRVMLACAGPVHDPQGALSGAVVAVMDVTDRMQAEQAVRDSDRRKDEFLAMLAHELRNPLAPISAAAELLSMGRLQGHGLAQTSEVILRQVKHMTAMVEDLLDVSRVTRGLVTLDQAVLDGRRVIADALEQVRPLLESRGHRVALHTPPQPLRVMGDHKRLVQVVTNLLNNAAKYTPPPGRIEVTLEAQDGRAVIAVADDGVGMDPELVGTAFELFAQARRTSDRSQGGLGIGLALVKRLIELHGGSVSAHSDGPGRGSRFAVALPLCTQSHEAHDPGGTVPAVPRSHALKVMVVDDNVDAAQMLALLVEALGYQVVVEHSSRQALARAAAEAPQVCLLDIGLPDIDGYELARRLRAQRATADAVLIAVTGYGQEQDRQSARRAGFDHHLVKPAQSARLAELLGAIAVTAPVSQA